MSVAAIQRLLSLSALAAVLNLPRVAASCNQTYLDGGLTILSQNLLDGAENDGSAAILVSKPDTYSATETVCKLLGEKVWNPDIQDFGAALNVSLAYQVFQGLAREDELYWVAKKEPKGSACRAINPNGEVSEVECGSKISGLCTQSAPVSNSSFADNSAPWQVKQLVDKVQLTGYRDYHTWKFRGIRFADTPDRFTYSKVKSFAEPAEVSAIEAGADCVQPIGEVRSGSSEDCLFLNVWTPYLAPKDDDKKTGLRPVMVYLYGGGLQSGSGKNSNTDGTNLASRGDVVVVSVNYRVGSIGFLAFNDGVHTGNYGVSDMVTALEWVKEHIHNFGGDASRVTLFGESSGAQSTHFMLSSPKAKGLFHRAIMQSDPTGYPISGQFAPAQYSSLEDVYSSLTTKVLAQAGCQNATDAIACLDKIGGFDLVNLSTNANAVVTDGTYIVDHELDLSKPGYAAEVDVMTGFNRDESGVLVDDYPEEGQAFADYFANKVASMFSLESNYTSGADLAPFFPAGPDNATAEQVFNASMRIASDGAFKCLDMAKAYSGALNGAFASTYAFEFNRTYNPSGYTRTWCDAPATDARPNGDPDAEYYKCHAGEQLVVFANERRAGQPDRDGNDLAFMQLVVDYWSAFARAGDPNPDREYLAVRGHTDSLAQVDATGAWRPVDPKAPTLRLLQWNGAQVGFVEVSQCEALGLAFDSLES